MASGVTFTGLFTKYKGKLFRVFIDKEGRLGIFATSRGGVKLFFPIGKIFPDVKPSSLGRWYATLVSKGYKLDDTTTITELRKAFGDEPLIVHPLVAELWNDWPDLLRSQKEAFKKVVTEDWLVNRAAALRTLEKWTRKPGTNAFWDELRAINEALLQLETSKKGHIKLFMPLGVLNREVKASDDFLVNIPETAIFSSSPGLAARGGWVFSIKASPRQILGHWRIGVGNAASKDYVVKNKFTIWLDGKDVIEATGFVTGETAIDVKQRLPKSFSFSTWKVFREMPKYSLDHGDWFVYWKPDGTAEFFQLLKFGVRLPEGRELPQRLFVKKHPGANPLQIEIRNILVEARRARTVVVGKGRFDPKVWWETYITGYVVGKPQDIARDTEILNALTLPPQTWRTVYQNSDVGERWLYDEGVGYVNIYSGQLDKDGNPIVKERKAVGLALFAHK